ncbi:MAG: carbon-nitrogen hydrolase family protein [bacterium]
MDFDPHREYQINRDKIMKWQSQAISKNSQFIKRFKSIAKKINICIAITFLEKSNSKPYNSVMIIDGKGDEQLTYRKVHICEFSMEAFCSPGDSFHSMELNTEGKRFKIGAMICYDREFPESARQLMLQGAELIIVPNACELDKHRLAQIETRSFENMIGIAVANYPHPKANGNSAAYSAICYDRQGESVDNLIARADEKEQLVIADFNLDEAREYRSREVWGGKYRRPDVYNY